MQLCGFLRSCGFKESHISWVPLSVMENQNLVAAITESRFSWCVSRAELELAKLGLCSARVQPYIRVVESKAHMIGKETVCAVETDWGRTPAGFGRDGHSPSPYVSLGAEEGEPAGALPTPPKF
ncbi:hypothetical protein EJ110_NYTH02708 [Nymphaea thermarum]|nr:hypothetical protein EJ110_NYTH02708 [Nymphaea thermarum]